MRSADDINHLHDPATLYVTFGDHAFSVFGPRMWNNLPEDVRLSTLVASFKAAAKTYLFVKYRTSQKFLDIFSGTGMTIIWAVTDVV